MLKNVAQKMYVKTQDLKMNGLERMKQVINNERGASFMEVLGWSALVITLIIAANSILRPWIESFINKLLGRVDGL